jgi:hypothetical protein
MRLKVLLNFSKLGTKQRLPQLELEATLHGLYLPSGKVVGEQEQLF